MSYSLTTQLAILQQAEYDFKSWRQWLQVPRKNENIARLQNLQPAQRTFKWRYLKFNATLMSFFIPKTWAITLALWDWNNIELLARNFLVFLAKLKLSALQKKKLQVVVIAGSYGKTSVKHIVTHFLAHQQATLMTPASYNTPLGIALTILRQLKKHHQIFVVELGEYQVGDLEPLLSWLRPQYGILTPLGFNHSERWQNDNDQIKIFSPLWEHKHAPQTLIIDDANKDLLSKSPAQKTIYYGHHKESSFQLKNIKLKLTGSAAEIEHQQQTYPFSTRLVGRAHLKNTLAAIALSHLLKLSPLPDIFRYGAYAPDIPRRLQVIPTTGALLIDNSYNTSPGAWQEAKHLLSKLQLNNLAVITGGFVELSKNHNQLAHQQMAADLDKLAALVVVVKSRYNQDLIKTLEKSSTNHLVVQTYPEALEVVAQQTQDVDYLWLEGGMREIYQ